MYTSCGKPLGVKYYFPNWMTTGTYCTMEGIEVMYYLNHLILTETNVSVLLSMDRQMEHAQLILM